MDELKHGWLDGWMDGWMNRGMEEWNEGMQERMDERIGGWLIGWLVGWLVGWVDEWRDERWNEGIQEWPMDPWTYLAHRLTCCIDKYELYQQIIEKNRMFSTLKCENFGSLAESTM